MSKNFLFIFYNNNSYFCEKNMINHLIILSNSSNNRDINLQIIKTLSEIILTITNSEIIYYFFSNNFINQVIQNNFERYDDDFISYYVNLLKSLSLKLDKITIQFFYFKNSNSFPLLERTLLLYNHPDPMIKNVVRSVFLTFCRLNISDFNEYIKSLPCINYFVFLSYRLRDLSIFINNLAGYNKNFNEQNKFNYQKLKDNHDDLIDQLLFLNDIFSLNNDEISNILINSLLYYYICPLLIDSLIVDKKDIKNHPKKGYISPQLSLYILSFIIFNCNNEFLINIIFELLFYKNINKDILYNYIISKPNQPLNYYFFWEMQRDNIDINYNMFLNKYFSKKYLIYLCKHNGTNFKEIKSIHEKYLKFFENDSNFDLEKDENFINLQKEFLYKLSNKQLEELIQNQRNISIATGIKIGLSKRENQLNILNILFQKTNNNGINLIRENIFNILLKSKNENILMGIITLIYISNNRKEINKNLLSNCLILNNDNLKELSDDKNIEKNNIIEHQTEKNIDEIKIQNNLSEGIQNNKNNDDFIDSKIEKNSNSENDNINQNNIVIDNKKILTINSNLNQQKIKKQNLMNYFNKYNYVENIDYLKEYIDLLLEILKIPKKYNNLIDEIIIFNLKNFLLSKTNNSLLTNEFKNSIKNILDYYINNIYSIINNNNFIIENLYENFINQWNIYCNDFNLKLKKYINETANYFLIPELSQNIEDYPFKIIEKDIDKFNQNLLTFFILNDFFLIINENSKDLIEKKCPIENPLNEYKIYSYFDLSIIQEELKFDFKLKKTISDSYDEMIGVIYKNILLIGNKEENKIKIKETIPIRTIELNYSKNNRLTINYNKNGKYLDKIFEFNTEEERKKIRDLLNLKRVEIKKWENSQVINYINSQKLIIK